MLQACSKKEETKEPQTPLTVSSKSLTLDPTSNSAVLTVSSSSGWAIYCAESWLSIFPSDGMGTQTVTITASGNNPGTTARTASLTVMDKSGQSNVVVQVIQNPPPVN